MDWKRWTNFMATSFTRHHSPGLLWGYVKDIDYQTKVRDITDLKQRISNAIAIIDEVVLQRTWQEIKYRLDVLCVTKGAHIKMY